MEDCDKKHFKCVCPEDPTDFKVFYAKISFEINQLFTDETAARNVIEKRIFVMLPVCEKFKLFTSNALVIASRASEALDAVSVNRNQDVVRLHEVVIVGVGTGICVREDYGSAYGRSFNVPDDPIWKVIRVYTISF